MHSNDFGVTSLTSLEKTSRTSVSSSRLGSGRCSCEAATGRGRELIGAAGGAGAYDEVDGLRRLGRAEAAGGEGEGGGGGGGTLKPSWRWRRLRRHSAIFVPGSLRYL